MKYWKVAKDRLYFFYLPLRAAAGRSSAMSKTAWASHWLGTPSITSPRWQGPCPSWFGSTEVWLWRQRRHPSDIFSFYSPKEAKIISLNISSIEIVQIEKHEGQLKYVQAVKEKQKLICPDEKAEQNY